MFKSALARVGRSVVSSKGMEMLEGGSVSYKINRSVKINGQKTWVHANSEQEYAEKLAKLFSGEKEKPHHNFKEYALNWFEVYCIPTVEAATAACYESMLRIHILPAFEKKDLEEITPDDIQILLNSMTGAKSTKHKVKIILGMIFGMALEDDLILKNPTQSKRIKVTGKDCVTTKVYTVEQMRYIVQHVKDVQKETDRRFLALQALHPMRLEEVLGLKWEDIDLEKRQIHIRRAVTHPDRNSPIIKSTKTDLSTRTIALSNIAASYLTPGKPSEFVIGGEEPISYHRVTCMCNRIRKDIEFEEKITPKRFRTTVLTDIYDRTKDIKATQAAAGHATAEMTLEHYIKGRSGCTTAATAVDSVYGD